MCRAYPRLTVKPDMWGEERRNISCFQRRLRLQGGILAVVSFSPCSMLRAQIFMSSEDIISRCVVSLHVRVEAVEWVGAGLHHYGAWGAWLCLRCKALMSKPIRNFQQKFPIFYFQDWISFWSEILFWSPSYERHQRNAALTELHEDDLKIWPLMSPP